MHVQRSDNVPGFASPHGEVVHELIGEKTGDAHSHSLAQIMLPPGKSSLKHYHPQAEESFYILAGRGSVILDDERRQVTAGDAIYIPHNVVHQIINDSNSGENLIFLAVCAPAWTPDNSVFVE